MRLKPGSGEADRGATKGSRGVNVVSQPLAALSLAALLALVPWSVAPVYAGGSGGANDRGAPSFRKDFAFRVTDQLSAQTQASVFPRRDVAFSLTQRL